MNRKDVGAHRRDWFVLVACLGILFAAGCDSRPHAPALLDEPVYANPREGFRFRVPDGWKQFAKADVPAGKLDKERLLVGYRHATPNTSAQFEVAMADLPESTDLAAYLSDRTRFGDQWRAAAAPERFEVEGVPAVRYAFTGGQGKDKMTREGVVFRRGERVYLFTAVYRTGDEPTRNAVREAVGSVMWKS